MDLQAYTAAHSGEWQRLEALVSRGRLSGPEADELIALYQAGLSELSTIKTTAGSSVVGERLSIALSRARLHFTNPGANLLSQLGVFFARQLPAALYRLRWLTLAVTAASVVVALLFGFWVASDPRVLASFADEATLRQLVEHDFVDYYSSNPAASFAGQVWTNNAWIAAQCIAFGVIGVYVPVVLLQNAMNVGMTGAVMVSYGQTETFFSYITPHGLLELTSIFVAGAAGLRIFWAWVAPGARPRLQALAEDGRALFTTVVGLIGSLLLSGIVEAFVTPAPWPVWVKVSIGALALALFLCYMLVIGRRAARSGETGDMAAQDAGHARSYSG